MPLASALTPRAPAWALVALHCTAVTLLGAGVAFDSETLVRAAGTAGIGAALALMVFLAGVFLRARDTAAP